MLIFGALKCLNSFMQGGREFIDTEQIRVFNFNTMFERVPQLIYLNPYRCGYYMSNTNTYEFDLWYANYMNSCPDAFREFVNLMREVYNGRIVYLLCDFSTEGGTNVIESLIKYILETYDYVSNVVHEEEDFDTLVEGEFSSAGIQKFDMQLEAYLRMFGDRGLENDNT